MFTYSDQYTAMSPVSDIIDLRRPRHHDRHYDRHYYPAHHNANVYFTEKGTSVI